MSVPESHYLSNVWKDGIFGKLLFFFQGRCQTGKKEAKTNTGQTVTDGKVAFVTGGNGTICSMQTRALVRLGANACIIGRNVEKTEKAAKDIASVRTGAKVIGIGACDVRNVSRAVRLLHHTNMLTFILARPRISRLRQTAASKS